jgi:electron transfer flavoprotein alpha subunit
VQGEIEQREPNIILVDVGKIIGDDLPLKAVKLNKKEVKGVPLNQAEIVFCGGYGLSGKGNWNKWKN